MHFALTQLGHYLLHCKQLNFMHFALMRLERYLLHFKQLHFNFQLIKSVCTSFQFKTFCVSVYNIMFELLYFVFLSWYHVSRCVFFFNFCEIKFFFMLCNKPNDNCNLIKMATLITNDDIIFLRFYFLPKLHILYNSKCSIKMYNY